jgi:hypothetical protein
MHHVFLTSALIGGEWSAWRHSRFTPVGKTPKYLLDTRLSGHQRTFLVLTGLEIRPVSRLSAGKQLYRLHNPGSCERCELEINILPLSGIESRRTAGSHSQ